MKNTTTLQSKRSITVLLGVLLYFSSLDKGGKDMIRKLCVMQVFLQF